MRKLTREDYELCDKIVDRAIKMNLYAPSQKMTAAMDIWNAAKHFNMKLAEWLVAEDFDFAHDIIGIAKAIDRTAFPVNFNNDKYFLPRFSNYEEDK